jgi:Flagellar hook-length control protein FliK
MNSTGAVSQQLPIASGEGAADKSRGAGRAGADEGGGFLKLVAKLAHAQGRAGGDDSSASGEQGEGQRPTLASWLPGGADEPVEQAHGGDPEAESSGQFQLPPQSGNLALLLALAGVNDAAALAQLLASTTLAQTTDPAAVAARIANGTGTDADAALVRTALAACGNGETVSVPDATVIANLAKASSQVEARRGGHALADTIAKVNVLGRETHLAPALAAAAVAAALAVERNGASTEPGQNATGTALAGAAGDPKLEAGLVDPRSAVTAVREARWGSHPRPDGSPSDIQQPAADASASVSDEGGVDGAPQTPATMRADGLANSTAAGGIVQQIANKVAAEANTLLGQAARPEASAPGQAQPLGTPMKVIHIQLQPEGLGAVSIRMAVKDQALQLALEVGRGDTASIIQRDRDTLSALLRSAGYVIDGVDVRMAGPSGVPPPTTDGQAGMQMQGGGQSRGSQPEGRQPGAGPQDDPRGSGFGNRRNSEDEHSRRTSGRGSGLYV